MSGVRREEAGGVAVVRLARPPVNALDADLVHELRLTFEDLAADPPLGLVLTHDGPAFCAGVDVKAIPTYDDDQRRAMVGEINAMITALYGLPSATVAAINGHVIGAGFVLMLACDVRLVADADIRLGLTEVTAGVPYPDGPLEVVRAELDPALQRRLVLTGDVITPREALHAAIVDETPGSTEVLDRALEIARMRGAAAAYGVVKRQLRGATLARMCDIVARPPVMPWD